MHRELLILAAIAVLSTPALAQQAQGDADAGAEVFAADCRACHGGMIAPALRGVFGRQIATLPGYSGYSEALKAKTSQSWTEATLDTFLTAPADFAPGTLMSKSVPDAQMRADIIAYLKSLPPPTAS